MWLRLAWDSLTAMLLPQLPECWDDRMQHHTYPVPIAASGSSLLLSESESDVTQASLKLLILLSPHLSAGVTGLHQPGLLWSY